MYLNREERPIWLKLSVEKKKTFNTNIIFPRRRAYYIHRNVLGFRFSFKNKNFEHLNQCTCIIPVR